MDYRDKQIKVNKAITVNLSKASVVLIVYTILKRKDYEKVSSIGSVNFYKCINV